MYKLDNLDDVEYYGREAIQDHRTGLIHIHGLSEGPRCRDIGWKIETQITPDSLTDFYKSILRELKAAANEWMGVQTIHGLDSVLPNILDEGYNHENLENMFRKLIKEVNLRGIKTNFHFKLNENTSSDKDAIQETLNSALKETLPIYPIPIYAIAEGFTWGNDEIEEPFKMASDHGFPYFLNIIDYKMEKDPTPDPRILYHASQGPHAYEHGFGSIGKITINLPHLAYQTGAEEDFLNRLGEVVEKSGKALEKKRTLLEERLNRGDMPQTSKLAESFEWYFSTIGIVGMNEALITLIEGTIANPAGKAVTYKTLEQIRERLIELQMDTGHPFNLEASDERIGNIFALKDRVRSLDIPAAGEDNHFYTHSTHLPVGYTDDLWEALEHQHKFQALYNSPAGFNIPLKERIHSYRGCRLLARGIIKHFAFPSFALTPLFSYCPRDGYLTGIIEECPKCDGITKTYTREGGRIQSINEMDKIYREVYERRRQYVVESKK